MDFRFTPEQDALRAEFEKFFSEEEKNAPPLWVGGWEAPFENDVNWAYHRSMADKLAKKNWLSLPWPRKYGGQEHSFIEQAIFNEVRYYHRIPGVDTWGAAIVAPSLFDHGSEEIKQAWLPRIASGEIDWCQGWSEPNAGSDLASLTTRAVPDGDDYVINGQKIWTSGAHRASHIFILARTDPNAPKNRGLTYFLSEMDRPGITVRPVHYMNRAHVFNEVFFDNLRVPKKNIVGEINNGWYVTMSGINYERSGAGGLASLQRDFDDLVKYCKETKRNGSALTKNALVRYKLAELAIDLQAERQWAYHTLWLQMNNPIVAVEPSASKYYFTELHVRIATTGLELMGIHGNLKGSNKQAPLKGRFEYLAQVSLGQTIGGGTSEIQKNIIARMGLQMPKVA